MNTNGERCYKECVEESKLKKKNRNSRNSRYFKKIRKMKKEIAATELGKGVESCDFDDRLYATVFIQGYGYRGLLDSGANVSVLGHGAEDFLAQTGIYLHSVPCTYISTASGSKERILGYVSVLIRYGEKCRRLTLFVVPSLKQRLYLGINFWKTFGLQPVMVNEVELINDNSPNRDANQHDLDDNQRKQLDEVVATFPDSAKRGLGKTSLLVHKIDVGEAVPVKQRFYAVSPAVMKDMDQEIERMLKLDVIEESESSWSSPMAIVKKKNGKIRLCLDARKVNKVTKKLAYPLPLIDGILSRLDKTFYISSIDLKDAFWQIPLDPESRDKTAFTIPGRPLYQFKVMPFGLCNAAQTLCKLMDKVIPHHLQDRVFVYLDDLLVTSSTLEEHLSLLSDISYRLEKAGLTINVEKSQFLMKKIEYLGFVVGGGKLRPNPEKVCAIADFPIPKTPRQVRRFLGVTGWYSRFVKNYSTVASPLTDLLKKGKKFLWSVEAQQSFDGLKEALLNDPVLVNPDFQKHFFIQCDASKTGVGAVLFQKSEDDVDHPIAFMSKKLNAAQRNYSVTELECLAAVLAIKKFRAYVEGMPFTVITDHSSLKWLMEQRDLSGRLARWSLKLQSFDFTIEHCKGSANAVPDALSRMYADAIDKSAASLDENLPPLNIDLNSEAFADDVYRDAILALNKDKDNNVNVKEVDGKLYINPGNVLKQADTDIPEWKLIVPIPLTKSLLLQAHCSPTAAHFGVEKTLERLQRLFFWNHMGKDVKDFVSKCSTCKMTKPVNFTMQPPMGEKHYTFRPFQQIYVDFLGPYPRSKLGNTHILIVMDHYSRLVLIKAIRRATAEVLVKYLEEEVFLVYGTPQTLISDNGRQFESNALKDLLHKYGVEHRFTPKYHPQPNASERANRSVLTGIRSYVGENQKEWDKHLCEIAHAMRNVTHSTHNFSPHFLVFGQYPINHGSQYQLLETLHSLGGNNISIVSKSERLTNAQEAVLRHMRKSYEKNAARYNLRSTNRKFVLNQLVYVRNYAQSDAIKFYSAKLGKQFVPARIIRLVGSVAYELDDRNGRSLGVFHCKDIKPE